MKLDIIFLTSSYGVKVRRESAEVSLRPAIPAGRENSKADTPVGGTGSSTEPLKVQPQPSLVGCRVDMHKSPSPSKDPSGKHLPSGQGES